MTTLCCYIHLMAARISSVSLAPKFLFTAFSHWLPRPRDPLTSMRATIMPLKLDRNSSHPMVNFWVTDCSPIFVFLKMNEKTCCDFINGEHWAKDERKMCECCKNKRMPKCDNYENCESLSVKETHYIEICDVLFRSVWASGYGLVLFWQTLIFVLLMVALLNGAVTSNQKRRYKAITVERLELELKTRLVKLDTYGTIIRLYRISSSRSRIGGRISLLRTSVNTNTHEPVI